MSELDIDQLLRPAVAAFKTVAERAIGDVTESMKNVLRVTHDVTPAMIPVGCPAPRLQFRWTNKGDDGRRTCHYEFIFPLRDHDIRNYGKSGFCCIELGRTYVGCEDDVTFDVLIPFRDGAHANWDAPHFGNPPIYVVTTSRGFSLVPKREKEHERT